MRAQPKKSADMIEEARKALRDWAQRVENEEIADRVGCSVRSVQNWLADKKMTRLSAKCVLDAWSKS
jgi:uncharacterized protein YjcR